MYGATNWLTSLRTDVGTWYFAWERWIPFVPVMIIPYMSIDAFFVAAPFLCRERAELKLLAARITLAILVAGTCFLLFPLRLVGERPDAPGWLGDLFRWFCGLDQPYNLCPSLHIALRTILAELYARHTRGPLRVALHTWFTLIGFSTVLTYQHHVVDVIGGFVLATVCFFVFRSPLATSRSSQLSRRRVLRRRLDRDRCVGGRHVAALCMAAVAGGRRGAGDRGLCRSWAPESSASTRGVCR